MELKSLEYIVAIDEQKSIAKAADKLYLTQSALNQHLLKLEKELGTPLFERRYHHMKPTFAGRVYLDSARRMLRMKEDAYKIIRDISDSRSGEISIAYTPERGSLIFSEVYPRFHTEYPGYRILTTEARNVQIEKLLLRQEVTYALLSYNERFPMHPDLDHTDFGREYIVLGLHKTHPLAHLAGPDSWKKLPDLDLRLLENENFILPSDDTMMRKMVDYIMEANKLHPKILFESSSTNTILRMIAHRLGAGFFPMSYADPSLPLVYFRTDPEQYWIRTVTYLRGTYISKPEQRLIDLFREHRDPVLF